MAASFLFFFALMLTADDVLGICLIVSFCDSLRLIVKRRSSLQDECSWRVDGVRCEAAVVFWRCNKQNALHSFLSELQRKRRHPGSKATGSALFGLIDEARRKVCTIGFFLHVFSWIEACSQVQFDFHKQPARCADASLCNGWHLVSDVWCFAHNHYNEFFRQSYSICLKVFDVAVVVQRSENDKQHKLLWRAAATTTAMLLVYCLLTILLNMLTMFVNSTLW